MDPLSSLLNLINSAVVRIWPDASEAKKAELALLLTEEINRTTLLTKQIDVNIEEAKSDSIFVSGWRPFLGWVCGLSFAWQFVGLPIAVFISSCVGHTLIVPEFDFATMSTVLMGMLGLGSLRTFEKIKKVNTK